MGSFIFLYGRALCHGEGEAFQCAVGGRGWQGFIAWLREGGSSAGGRCWWDDEICNFFRAKWEGFSEHSGGMWGGAPSARGCCRWDGGICSVLGGGVPSVVEWCRWDDAPGDSGDTSHMGKEKENELLIRRESTGWSVGPLVQTIRFQFDYFSFQLGRIKPEPWLTYDRTGHTGRSGPVLKTMVICLLNLNSLVVYLLFSFIAFFILFLR